LKYWFLIRWYKHIASIKWSKIGCASIIVFPFALIIYAVFIPLAIIDFIFFIVVGSFRQFWLKDTIKYRHSIQSIVSVLSLGVFCALLYGWISRATLWDWRLILSGAVLLWLLLSPLLIKVICRYQVYEQETRIIKMANDGLNARLQTVLSFIEQMNAFNGYANPEIIKSVSDDLALLDQQRKEYLSRVVRNQEYLTSNRPKKAKLAVSWQTYIVLGLLVIVGGVLFFLKVNGT
jgi:hypothetical protein